MSRAVIDQPGLRVLTIGLALSAALGFLLRTQISSSRVQKSLSKSVSILQKDFLIDFDQAEVRLTKWGLPLPHLVVEKLRISPKKSPCQNSQIFIDELEIPLQLKNIFTSEKNVDLVRAKNVEVRLVDIDACLAPQKPQPGTRADAVAATAKAELDAVQTNIFSQRTGTRLKEVAIDQLKIVSLKNYQQPIIFKQLRFFLNYENSRLSRLDIRSRLYSIKDRRTDIYFLISDVNAQIKPDAQQNIEFSFQLKGRLLDGDIQIFGKGSSQNQKLSFEMTTQNVSIKAYAPLLQRSEQAPALDRWPLSLSFDLVGEAQLSAPQKSESKSENKAVTKPELKALLKFHKLEANGDNMSVRSPEINFEFTNQHYVLSPFDIAIDRLPLVPLKILLADQYDFQSVENLGVLSGRARFEDSRRWSFEGDIRHAEFIFSNRGSRELEIIDSVAVRLNNQENHLKMTLDDIVIQQNQIAGQIEGEYVKDPSSWQLRLNLEGALLNEKIWRQLTLVPQNPAVKVSWVYQKAAEERHQLKINAPELRFPGLRLSDVQVDFLQIAENESRSLVLSLKSGPALVQPAELAPHVVQAFFNEQTGLGADVDYTTPKMQGTLQGPDWKNMSFELDSVLFDVTGAKNLERFRAQGEWKADGSLTGTSSLQNPQRALRYGILKNSRDEIDFLPEKKQD